MTLPVSGLTTSVCPPPVLLVAEETSIANRFWAFPTDELGNWRPERNGFGKEHFEAYHSRIDKSEPLEDYDDRNTLYAL